MGAPPGDTGARRTRPQSGRQHPPPSDQRPPPRHPSPARRRSRCLPHQQGSLPRLPHRAHQRLADRDRDRRGRLPPSGQRPNGPHRSPLGTRRRRSNPEATRHQSQRRLRGVLALPPHPRTPPRPRSPLPQPHHPSHISAPEHRSDRAAAMRSVRACRVKHVAAESQASRLPSCSRGYSTPTARAWLCISDSSRRRLGSQLHQSMAP